MFATTATINTSDARQKRDIADLPYGLSSVMALRPVTYHWRQQGEAFEGRRLGFIAQELLPVLPEAVTGTETDSTYLGLRSDAITPVLVKAIQEQQQQIEVKAEASAVEALKAENDALKRQLEAQEQRLRRLEELMNAGSGSVRTAAAPAAKPVPNPPAPRP